MKMYNKLTCLFGHHDYSDKLTKDRHGSATHLCKICKRSGYYKYLSGSDVWGDYDKEGNCRHQKWTGGHERWFDYDDEGNLIHEKGNDGREYWWDNYGHWVTKKPKNWVYDEK